ncbi:hypothetical protein HHJ46_13530 [Escherichia coli]|nr:hypothetical protein HHJ46_13530 [Escherichia coli]
MLHGGDGIRAVVVLTDTHAAEQALAQRRQLQPHTLYSATPSGTRLTFTFTPSVTDWTSTLTGLPCPSTGLISVVPEDGSVISRSSVSVRSGCSPPARDHRC